jgi:GST-like protein
MITLHTWTTPNGRKISIALEEMALPYEVKPINIGAGEQFSPGYLAISPNRAPEKIPQAIDRFTDEAVRLVGVAEKRLAAVPYLGGEAYSIADMAAYPWLAAGLGILRGVAGKKLAATPGLDRWLAELSERPAVKRGMAVPEV